MNAEFDVWSSTDGRLKVTAATAEFVDNSDAPYSFDVHEIRVEATNKREALKVFRSSNLSQT